MTTKWIPLIGTFDIRDEVLEFRGRLLTLGTEPNVHHVPSVGISLADTRFAGGSLQATVVFSEVDDRTAAELLIYRDPRSDFQVTAGLGGSRVGMCTIRHYDGKNWTYHRDVGVRRSSFDVFGLKTCPTL
jgi:hypothetical protein